MILVVIAFGAGIYLYFSKNNPAPTSVNDTVTLTPENFTPFNTLEGLVRTSSIIVVGSAIDNGVSRTEGTAVFTDYRVSVIDSKISTIVKKDDVIMLSMEGGVKDGKKYTLTNAPEITKDKKYILFAITNTEGLLRPLASGTAVAKDLGDGNYELPSSLGLPDSERIFTLAELDQVTLRAQKK